MKDAGLCHFMQDAPYAFLAMLMHFKLTTRMAAVLSWPWALTAPRTEHIEELS